MRLRRLVLSLLALMVLVPSAFLAWVMTTEQGLRFVTARLTTLGPVQLRIEGVEGSLSSGVRLARFELHHRRVHIVAQRLSGRVDLLPLVWQTVSLRSLAIDDLLVEVPRVPDSGKRWNERFLPSFLHIDVRRLQVARGRLHVMENTRFDARDLSATAAVHPRWLRVYRGALDLGSLHLDVRGDLRAQQRLPFTSEVAARWRPAGQPEWRTEVALDGTLDDIPLQARIVAPMSARIEGHIATPTKGWRFEGKGSVDEFRLEPFGGGGFLGALSGELDLQADRDGFGARGTAVSSGLAAGPFEVDFAGRYAARVLTILETRLRHRGGGGGALVAGSVTLRDGQRPLLELSGSWQDLRWPLRDAASPFHSRSGRFTLRGDRPYALTAEAPFRILDLPEMQAQAEGQLLRDRVQVGAATLSALGGQGRVRGEARWSGQRGWEVSGELSGIEPQRLRPGVTGRLDLDLLARGNRFSADTDLQLELRRLAGRLGDTPARGRGSLSRGAGRWQFDDIELRLGTAALSLDGELESDRQALAFSLQAADLSLLLPEAGGRLNARGRLGGSRSAPTLSVQAEAARLVLRGLQLRSADLDIDMDLQEGGSMRARADAAGLEVAGRRIDEVALRVDGRAEQHSVLLSLAGPGIVAELGAAGGYADGRWLGSLRDARVGDGGELMLEAVAPAAVQLDPLQQALESLCLAGSGGAQLCLEGRRGAGGWSVGTRASGLPLRTLTAGLSPDIDYEGTITVDARFAQAAAQAVTGELSASLRDAQLRRRLPNGREERFALGTGVVEARMGTGDFTFAVGLDAGKAGNIEGRLAGRREGPAWREHPVAGDFSLESAGLLGLLDVYLTGIDRASGRLSMQAQVAGRLGAPDLTGRLRLRDGEIDQYPVNLALRGVELDAQLEGSTLSLEGRARAGDGQARFKGRMLWRQREPSGELHVEGEDLRVVNVPEARIHASPRLDFRIDGRRIEVKGDVRVPLAVLEPVSITNATLSSGDEVMAGAPPRDALTAWQVVSDINLVLGERVSLDTFGLKGRLTGTLRTQTDANQVNRGSGELNVVPGGRYAAFGRNLDIARGRLIYNNVPLADPAIDLRAQKVYPDVTAGVNVRGSLRAPRMTFFSEPAIPQSQIVSLILAGGSLDSVQSSSRPGAARNEALAQGGAILAQQIGNRLGIEDVGIESDMNNETSLVLGKYLSPRLYVSYGISLAEAVNTLKLRYTIGDRWTLKTEAGNERAADLVYTIQR
ncbi:MAG: hypothetical protein RL026_1059 [Pseudomonadota bacterium]|jgi:translocation and assembly module TamB